MIPPLKIIPPFDIPDILSQFVLRLWLEFVNSELNSTPHPASPLPPLVDMKKLVTIIRKSGYRGNIPIETLSMKRKDYDPFVEVPKVLNELRAAIEATVAVKPEPR